MRLIFQAQVSESGKLTIYKRNDFLNELHLFAGKKVVITVEKKRKKRSNDQNSYYWSVVVPMFRAGLLDVGYKVSLEETHTFLKSKFLVKEIVNNQTGEILTSVKSTTELSTTDFMVFIEEIQQFAIEFLNVNIPSPNEQLNIEL